MVNCNISVATGNRVALVHIVAEVLLGVKAVKYLARK